MITFSKSFVCTDGNVFASIDLAKTHELKTLIIEELVGDPSPHLFADMLVRNAEKVVDILTTTKTSKPRGRSVNGGKKPRKTNPETPTLPGV